MKLDLRPKAFVILDTTIDMEDSVAAYYSKMTGFEGVESRDNSILVNGMKPKLRFLIHHQILERVLNGYSSRNILS